MSGTCTCGIQHTIVILTILDSLAGEYHIFSAGPSPDFAP